MEIKILEELIEKGLSQRELADELNCSQSNIKYWLKKFDIKTKNNKFNKRISDSKICPICKTEKHLSEFYSRVGRDDVAGYCKKCSNVYHSNRVKNVKLKMLDYKGNKCEDCNLSLEESHYCVFDFHHINPNDKDPNFDKIKFQKWDKIKTELDKCVLLCSNCHRLRHAKIESW